MHRIAVLGGGSFGTAIANMIASNGYATTLWVRNPDRALEIAKLKENRQYLPGYILDDSLNVTSSLSEALNDVDSVFFVVPSKAFRQVAREVQPMLKPDAMVISAAKGIESSTFKLMSEILEEELPQANVGVLSGPNLAKEIIQKRITASVIASKDDDLCDRIQALLGSSTFRVYANHDRFGVELAGALKNIYAIISGMAAAMELGMNTSSVIITRSLAEMSRFATKMGANPMTFLGLAGVGDLFVSCTSPLSRNFQVGMALAKGVGVDEATASLGQVAEGVNTTRIVKLKADELGVYMPLASALFDVMYNDLTMKEAIGRMMQAEQNDDVEFMTRQ